MPALSFKERFIPLIKSGAKRQTIRGIRKDKRVPKMGEILYLYYGMRTKFCMKIMETLCLGTDKISITATGIVKVGNTKLSSEEKEILAVRDGFENFEVMLRWWKLNNTLPFVGIIIHW